MELLRFSKESFDQYLEKFIDNALKEDVGDGDHTSQAVIPGDMEGKAKLLVKEAGILAGIEVCRKIFQKLDPKLKLDAFYQDGNYMISGKVAFQVTGPLRSILTGERLVLNCLQHLSGIATKTHRICEKIKGHKARLLDTRKTTPGMRLLEKWAVRTGGGMNHRMGLYDMILIKDNHIDAAGSIKKAVQRTARYFNEYNKSYLMVVEVRNFKELDQLLELDGIDQVLLDNFTPDELMNAVKRIKGKMKAEASGGINEENIREYAATGVDYISTSELTRNFKPLDMSLKGTAHA